MQWYHPYCRKWRGTKELLDESERGDQKASLKLNIHKTKIMASSPIPSWQIDREAMETMVVDFKLQNVTIDGDCSMKIKGTCFLEEQLRQT